MDRLVLCDHSGWNFPAIRATLQTKIANVYKGMDVSVETVPEDDVERDEEAYIKVNHSPCAKQAPLWNCYVLYKYGGFMLLIN